MEWQPIETAPERGPILIVCMNAKMPTVTMGYYRCDKAYGGTRIRDWYIGQGCSMAPTHWMPLPDAPNA